MGGKNQDAVINFCLLFPFFLLLFISHYNIIHREICVKDFSGTAVPRNLKFGTNVGYELLCCVRENQHAAAYYSPYLSIFLSLQANVSVTNFSASMRASLQILYTHSEWPSILSDRKQNSDLFCLISHFFHLSLQCNT